MHLCKQVRRAAASTIGQASPALRYLSSVFLDFGCFIVVSKKRNALELSIGVFCRVVHGCFGSFHESTRFLRKRGGRYLDVLLKATLVTKLYNISKVGP